MSLLPGYPLLALMHDDPIPVLLSILTLKPQRVIVAHSNEGVLPARHLRDYLAQEHPQISLQLFNLGDPEDLPQISEKLKKLQGAPYRLSAPYRLDYSAASPEQLVAGIWQHLDDHCDYQITEPGYTCDHLRSYIDQRRGLLVCDDSSAPTPLDTTHLSLDSLVRLRGYRLTSKTENVRIKPGHEQAVRTALQKLIAHLESADFGQHLPGLEGQVRNLTQHLDGVSLEQSNTQSPSKVNGDALELCTLAALAVAIGQADHSVELRMSATVSLLPRVLNEENPARQLRDNARIPAYAEFDALLRIGHRVYTYESKGSARNARPLFYERDVRSRAIFGDATCSALVTRNRTRDREDLKLLYQFVEEINNAIPPSYSTKVYILDSVTCLSPLTDDAAQYLAESHTHRMPQRLHAQRIAADPLGADSLGGEPVSTQRSDDAAVSATAESATTSESHLVCAVDNPALVVQASIESDAKSVTLLGVGEEPPAWSSPLLRPDHRGTSWNWIRIPELNQDAAYHVAQIIQPAQISTVAGPANVVAGFIHYVWDMGSAQLVHITRPDSQLGIQVWRGNPVDGWESAEPSRAIPWDFFIEKDRTDNPSSVPAYQRITAHDSRLGTMTRRYLEHCLQLNPDIEVWYYRARRKETDRELLRAQKSTTNILVTSPFSTCTVSVLGEGFGHNGSPVGHSSMKDELVQILNFEADAERIVGRLNGHIVVQNEVALSPAQPQNLLVKENTEFTWDVLSDVSDWTAVTSDLDDPALYRWLE